MKLSSLKNKTRKTQVTIDGESAEIEYRVHALTVDFLVEIKELGDLESIVAQVERVVARWDVLDDNGNEILTTREAILANKIPMDFLTAVLVAVTEDLRAEKNA